jgi:methanogenic corrinoid protein MtbC1
MVGGAPVSAAFAEEIESDAYGRDAATAVDIAKRHMAWKNEKNAVTPDP